MRAHFYGSHAVLNEYTGVVLDLAEGKRIAELVPGDKLVILQNHGLLSLGRGVDEACWHFIAADRSCHAQLLADAAGKPIYVDEDVARPLGEMRVYGGRSFLHYYDTIVADQPDLLN